MEIDDWPTVLIDVHHGGLVLSALCLAKHLCDQNKVPVLVVSDRVDSRFDDDLLSALDEYPNALAVRASNIEHIADKLACKEVECVVWYHVLTNRQGEFFEAVEALYMASPGIELTLSVYPDGFLNGFNDRGFEKDCWQEIAKALTEIAPYRAGHTRTDFADKCLFRRKAFSDQTLFGSQRPTVCCPRSGTRSLPRAGTAFQLSSLCGRCVVGG